MQGISSRLGAQRATVVPVPADERALLLFVIFYVYLFIYLLA